MYRIQSLNGTWDLYQADKKKYLGPANVPGSVLLTMLEQGKIEDPFWRCNEYQTRELMAEDYIYERSFQVESLDYDCVELVCFGLDTIVSVTLNETLILSADDMHRTYRVSVKDVLRKGENHISFYFSSALTAAQEEDARNDIFYASTGAIHGNAVIRKSHCMFGWDWGPQLPDIGIFRDVVLEYRNQPRFEDCKVTQRHEQDGSVTLILENEISERKSLVEQDSMTLEILVEEPNGNKITKCIRWTKNVAWKIETPRLWWPNGVGEHPLYQITLVLKDKDGEICDSWSKRIGLRTVTVCTDANEYGNEFAFVVNGVKIFAMGANYIPQDSLICRVDKKKIARLVKDCEKANYNCIRVWGGGYYPEDTFYDYCDEAGILIWQDLMFGCNVYALNDHFEENIVEETKDNVRRLRHHACLALWCGNNEMEWGWGDEWARIKGHHPRYKADYLKIFEYILPKAIRSCDDVTFYWPSSPSSGGSYDDPNGVNRGDQHYWDVWHSGKPFTEYRKNYFTFCSEYGFQSFPGRKTIESFTLPEDRNIFSRVMESHQKNGAANGKILNYVADYFLYPDSLDSLAYISQVLQLKAIQYGVEHWRRNRGRCMGSLYWQINDCWPVASWASIDYYGRWKALHYGAKRFYRPVMVSACEKEELSTEIGYYVNNDTLESFEGMVEVALLDRDMHQLWSRSKVMTAAPMSVEHVLEIDFAKILKEAGEVLDEERRGQLCARVRLFENGECISEQVTLFVKPKHFAYRKPEYQAEIAEKEDRFEFTVTSNAFAQYVELDFTDLDAVFSDNYFDITCPEGRIVWVLKSDLPECVSCENLKAQLTMRSVADTYEFG